nr:hypothetical protein [Tanacetum cinerariifolium]
MPILDSFKECKLEYEDEDEVEIKMIGTRMDKQSLEHNLYENDISLMICHNFPLTSNPPSNQRIQLQLPQGSPQPTINLELPLIRETKPLFKMAESQCNKFKGDKGKVILVLVIRVMLLVLGETMQVDRQWLLNATTVKTEDLDTYDYDCDDVSNAKAVLMANISNYGSDVISEVPHSKTYLNDMENQSVHAIQDFEQSPVVDFIDIEIHSDSNIIPYS